MNVSQQNDRDDLSIGDIFRYTAMCLSGERIPSEVSEADKSLIFAIYVRLRNARSDMKVVHQTKLFSDLAFWIDEQRSLIRSNKKGSEQGEPDREARVEEP